jgi:hypothetical protein
MKWQYVLQSVVCVLGAVPHVIFNDVILLIIFTKTVTSARLRRMLPDDGPNGPKHVGAI